MYESYSNAPDGGHASRSWRPALLWGAFVFLLATGLVLALRFGDAVPALLDGVLQ